MRGFFLSWFGGVGQRVCFVFFVTRSGRWQWTSSSSSSSSSAVHHLRPSTHTLFSLSLSLSFFLSFFSLPLSLSTDNNNFTKDKVLSSRAKQQRAKQNPKKKKRDRDFWWRFIRKIFWADRFPSFQWRLVQPRRKTQKKKKTAYPDSSSTWLQIAPRLPFTKPHHTNKSTPFFASPIQSVKKVRLLFSQYLSFFFLPILQNQNPFWNSQT